MNNRAIVIIKAGRADLADALASGAMAGRAQRQQADRLSAEQRAMVSAEIDRQRLARQLHVAIGKNRGAKEYADLCFEADMAYGESLYDEGRLHRLARRALGLYGLLVMALRAAYRAQDRVLEP